ncbi:MAG: hypothetical protein Q9219_003238 [cf. Caloplaca sp. 3 TL-2023]
MESDFERLLEDATKHIQDSSRDPSLSATLRISYAPKAIDNERFVDFVKQVVEIEEGASHEEYRHILAGEAYMRDESLDLETPGNHAAATKLQEWVIKVISPTNAFAEQPPFDPESKHVASPNELSRLVSMKTAGLHLLSHLQKEHPSGAEIQSSCTACLASFTRQQDPWTSQEAYGLARSILSRQLDSIRKDAEAFKKLIEDLLLSHIKPFFVRSRNPILTDQARKAVSPLPRPNAPSDFQSTSKPWKFQSPHIVTIFQWVLNQLDSAMVETTWPLVIPPLLAIVDDVSTAWKTRGCELLLLLLNVVPTNLLERSGLGEVFHDTVMPYLLYLPSLTPEDESIPLLDAAYTALIVLSSAHYGTSNTTASRIRSLDAIFRYGILKGHSHAGENVRIASLLLKKSSDLVDAMGIYCVKHLKDIIPLILAALTAPFATAYPPLLQTALQTLRAVILNGWPRVSSHKGEILEGLVICWCRIDDEEPDPTLLATRKMIEDISHVLMHLLRNEDAAKKEIQMLRNYDPRFKALLAI